MYRRKVYFFFSSRRRHTRCALVTGVQTCALPIYVVMGGAGSAVAELLNESGVVLPILHLGLPDAFQHHASREDLLAEAGLDDAGIRAALLKRWPELAKPWLQPARTVAGCVRAGRLDRKVVAWGKSGSVRVERGGARCDKNNN